MRTRRSGFAMDESLGVLIEEQLPTSVERSLRVHRRFMGRHGNVVVVVLLLLLFISFYSLQSSLNDLDNLVGGSYDSSPLSLPQKQKDGSTWYNIGVVTDLDHDSKDGKKWKSYFKKGVLKHSANDGFTVNWRGDDVKLETEIAAGGRAMELSDLVVFDHRLLTVDDRTGLIYEIENNKVYPWVFLDDGPGKQAKPLKGEWMTVRDKELWVGGLGKEWSTSEGEFINDHPMWVKVVDKAGRVRHMNWTENYIKVRRECGILPPGYMVHESVQWSQYHRQWFFLPRRASNEKYNDTADEQRGTNMLISSNADFTDISMVRVGKGIYQGPRGFSAFQFLPNSDDQVIVALKSEEIEGKPSGSFITVFDVSGTVLLPETPIPGSYKFEGLAFI